jgi:hypothetical protein
MSMNKTIKGRFNTTEQPIDSTFTKHSEGISIEINPTQNVTITLVVDSY